jgi:hypothetical protein
MNLIINRMIRAAKLDVNLYEEVESDKSSLSQAITVVILSSIAGGIGSAAIMGVKGLLVGTLSAVLAWFIWAYIVYYIGAKIIPEPQTNADHGELLRTLGFSSAPGIIRILGIIPGLYYLISLAATIWMLAAMVVAVRQSLDYKSTPRAIFVCLIGAIAYGIITVLVAFLFAGLSGLL